jgi:hypothetical protein
VIPTDGPTNRRERGVPRLEQAKRDAGMGGAGAGGGAEAVGGARAEAESRAGTVGGAGAVGGARAGAVGDLSRVVGAGGYTWLLQTTCGPTAANQLPPWACLWRLLSYQLPAVCLHVRSFSSSLFISPALCRSSPVPVSSGKRLAWSRGPAQVSRVGRQKSQHHCQS